MELLLANPENDFDQGFLADKEHVFLTNFQPARKWTLIANCLQAIYWVLVKRPDVIITTGAGVVVPTVFSLRNY